MNPRPTRSSTPCALAALIIAFFLFPPGEAAASGNQIPLPEIEKESLLNGMEFLILPSQQPQSQFLLMIRNGAAFDPVDKWGATLLTARMMLLETEARSQEQMQFALRSIQAVIEVRVEHDAIYFHGTAPMGRVGAALELLGEIITRPSFKEETFEQLRGELIDELQARSASPEARTQQILNAKIFVPHPYGRPIEGTAESLRNLTLNDLKIQYRRLFMPNQAQLALYFTGDREGLRRNLGRSWGRWIRQKALPFTFRRAPRPDGGQIFIIDGPAESSLMRWGRLGVARNDPDYHTWKVFEQYVLLHLPEWARQVESESHIQASPLVEARRMPGRIQLSIQAPPAQLLDYLKLWRRFLKDIAEGKIDPQAFEEARRLARLDFIQALEQPRTRLEVVVDMTLFEVGSGYVTTYGMRLDRVTPERLQRALENLSPDDFTLVVSAPAASVRDGLEGLGKVETLPAEQTGETAGGR